MKTHSPRFLAAVDDAKTRIREITAEAVLRHRAAGDLLHVVDVREESEWATAHIQGARHLGKGILERDVEAAFPEPDSPLVLYCGGGFRSALAADALQRMGYTQVWSLQGGWRAWKAAGGPTL